MDRITALRIYVRVAELASFTRAADSLGTTKASVSTAIRQLETSLGTRLLHRTTRKVQTTHDGTAFYERCKDLLADIDELDTMFERGASLRGRLRVDMSSGLARHLVIPRLPAFLAAHPRLEIELGSSDRRVDLVREGYDCVVRVGTLGESSLVARPLGHMRIVNCASPRYLAEHGVPRTLEDLAAHRLIRYVGSFDARADGFEYRDGDRYRMLAMPGALTVNSAEAYEASCLAGLGIIQAPAVGVRSLLERGMLVEVLGGLEAEPMPVSLLYAHRRNLPTRLRAFMAWIEDAVRDYLA